MNFPQERIDQNITMCEINKRFAAAGALCRKCVLHPQLCTNNRIHGVRVTCVHSRERAVILRPMLAGHSEICA